MQLDTELAGLVTDDDSRHVVELPKLPTSHWKGFCFRSKEAFSLLCSAPLCSALLCTALL